MASGYYIGQGKTIAFLLRGYCKRSIKLHPFNYATWKFQDCTFLVMLALLMERNSVFALIFLWISQYVKEFLIIKSTSWFSRKTLISNISCLIIHWACPKLLFKAKFQGTNYPAFIYGSWQCVTDWKIPTEEEQNYHSQDHLEKKWYCVLGKPLLSWYHWTFESAAYWKH